MSNQAPSVSFISPDEQQQQQQQQQSLSRRPSSARSILLSSNKPSGVNDLLHGLKIMTTGQPEQSTPSSPVPTQLQADLPSFNNIEDFDLQQPIGYGSSAIVYSALYKPMNKRVAVKIIDLDMFERNQIDELRRETALMALSKHPNVLRVYGSFVNESKLYIVTPYSAGGSCLDIMKTGFPNGFDEMCIATILKQALEGIAYFHKNGHIHRDVKAGNLLMDDDGTVLLADFGVSSSLMESGERGKRKTFVGTPCWMAPEVMEQAGYDYKADIWSFGVTSIELATGHAPYAKYPPLKVLMMTLSNEPPSLDREATGQKYSKSLKDMIDSCLVKDPEKRPTAEKLLQHPFFKQSKRKDYLVKSILQDLTPLEQRPRKKISQRQMTITKTDEWDFDNDDTSEDTHSAIPPSINNSDPSQQQQQQQQKLQQQQQHHTPKRHISFGDVVVRNPQQPSAQPSSPAAAIATTTMTTITSEQMASSKQQQPKKSRFVIEETSYSDHPGSMLTSSSMRSLSPSSLPDATDSKDDQLDSEITKVGRFHINQSASRQQSTSDPSHGFPDSMNDDKSNQDTSGSDRKSRFEVLNHSPQASSTSIIPYQGIPLSRENSNHGSYVPSPSALSREGSARARSPLAEREFDNQSTGESRKIGRFELTTGGTDPNNRFASQDKSEASHPYDSSHSLSASSSTTSPSSSLLRGQTLRTSCGTHDGSTLLSQFEELIRSNESQRQMIQEIYLATGLHKQKSAAMPPKSNERPSTDDLPATVTYLEQLVQSSTRENLALQKENDALRREIEQLRGLH